MNRKDAIRLSEWLRSVLINCYRIYQFTFGERKPLIRNPRWKSHFIFPISYKEGFQDYRK